MLRQDAMIGNHLIVIDAIPSNNANPNPRNHLDIIIGPEARHTER